MTGNKRESLGKIDADSGELILDRFPNGGWIVRQHHGGGVESDRIGAFSSTKDMLEALGCVLLEMDE